MLSGNHIYIVRHHRKGHETVSLFTVDAAVVGYLDILGFRNLVRADANRGIIAARLDRAMERALEWFGGKAALKGTADAEWRVRVFSDCVCVAKAATDLGILVTLDAISAFSREMIASGFPIRGGLTTGPYSDSDQLIFSQAQIDAYDLESKQAQYPRIVLSTDLMNSIGSMSDDEMRLATKEFIITDRDVPAFVNFLIFEEEDVWLGGNKFYLKQKGVIERSLGDVALQANVREKYAWMAQFHNWSLFQTARTLKQSGELDEDSVWSFSSLLIPGAPINGRFRCLAWSDSAFQKPWYIRDDKDIDWIRQWPGVGTEDDEPEEGV